MAPLTPHWEQPSHPEIQDVIINVHEFTSKSLSKVSLPPFGLYAKLDFPPCTLAGEPTYATVQCGRDKHLNLNSDLLYINHSCEPSLIFDTANFNIIAGPNGLRAGEELTVRHLTPMPVSPQKLTSAIVLLSVDRMGHGPALRLFMRQACLPQTHQWSQGYD